MAVIFYFAHATYAASREWIEGECINANDLHDAVGIRAEELAELRKAWIIPRPTYEIYDTGISSPIASLGVRGRRRGTYYGPAIIGWLRRAAIYSRLYPPRQLPDALKSWLEDDFRAALLAQSDAAARFGWSHLFEGGGLSPHRFKAVATQLWHEWLGGGWAVCLKRFSGHDVVTKDIEVERIPALLECQAPVADLIDAMLRFDEIIRPFAPFERPISSRYRVIDKVVADHDLRWPSQPTEKIAA